MRTRSGQSSPSNRLINVDAHTHTPRLRDESTLRVGRLLTGRERETHSGLKGESSVQISQSEFKWTKPTHLSL